jgi:hypothetical protein
MSRRRERKSLGIHCGDFRGSHRPEIRGLWNERCKTRLLVELLLAPESGETLCQVCNDSGKLELMPFLT